MENAPEFAELTNEEMAAHLHETAGYSLRKMANWTKGDLTVQHMLAAKHGKCQCEAGF
jgi:hypothetical protein